MKHPGDLVAAAALADEAKCMDLADRYINSECVKRMLQADQVLWVISSYWLFHLIMSYCFHVVLSVLYVLHVVVFSLLQVALAEKTDVLATHMFWHRSISDLRREHVQSTCYLLLVYIKKKKTSNASTHKLQKKKKKSPNI